VSNRVFGIEWRIDPRALGRSIEREYADELLRRIRKLMADAAPEAEAHMKAVGPWRDRTGAARKLLMAETVDGGDEITLYLVHGAAHGIFLELRWGGKYAVIVPTTHEFAARIRSRLQGIMN
jgi:hypothetical protein